MTTMELAKKIDDGSINQEVVLGWELRVTVASGEDTEGVLQKAAHNLLKTPRRLFYASGIATILAIPMLLRSWDGTAKEAALRLLALACIFGVVWALIHLTYLWLGRKGNKNLESFGHSIQRLIEVDPEKLSLEATRDLSLKELEALARKIIKNIAGEARTRACWAFGHFGLVDNPADDDQ